MHLITFIEANSKRIGVLDPARNEVIDLSLAAPDLPRDMVALIAGGADALSRVREATASAWERLTIADIRLLAPIPRPGRNIFCVGKNYRDHVTELKSVMAADNNDDGMPKVPIIFTKATSSVIGPGMPIPASLDATNSVDYEGELAVVIGKGGRGILRAAAMDHVFGYTIINDVTSRRLQKRHQQWFLGKSLDGFCPMGPSLVTKDEIPDVARLSIQTRVNGELRQDGLAAHMIFDIPALITTLAQTMTLESGDIIATGTPAGVGMGFKPPRFLQKGDTVSITIAPLGTLENGVT